MQKFKVEFSRYNGERVLVGYCASVTGLEEVVGEISPNLKNCSKMIRRFLNNYPNFKYYYTRITGPHNKNGLKEWCYDVGSWSEFFYVTELNETVEEDYYWENFEMLYPEKKEEDEDE